MRTENTAGRENGRRRPRGYADWRPQKRTREPELVERQVAAEGLDRDALLRELPA